MMLKNYLNYFLTALLLFGPIAPAAMAKSKGGQRPSADQIKIKVAKLGTGAKAKATVWLADGTKIKGYVAQAGDDDFIIRDRNTNTPTTVRYADVVKLDRNNGHSTAKWVGIGAGIGAGAFVLILLAVFAHLDD
jgi:hypothetical protein